MTRFITIRKFLRFCRCLFLRGYKFKCPLCDNTLRRFLLGGAHYPVLKEQPVIGGGYRLNFKCPCGRALDRKVAVGQNDPVRIYARDYRDRLERVGFKVEEFDWNADERFGGVKNQLGLNKEEWVYWFSKLSTAK